MRTRQAIKKKYHKFSYMPIPFPTRRGGIPSVCKELLRQKGHQASRIFMYEKYETRENQKAPEHQS